MPARPPRRSCRLARRAAGTPPSTLRPTARRRRPAGGDPGTEVDHCPARPYAPTRSRSASVSARHTTRDRPDLLVRVHGVAAEIRPPQVSVEHRAQAHRPASRRKRAKHDVAAAALSRARAPCYLSIRDSSSCAWATTVTSCARFPDAGSARSSPAATTGCCDRNRRSIQRTVAGVVVIRRSAEAQLPRAPLSSCT